MNKLVILRDTDSSVTPLEVAGSFLEEIRERAAEFENQRHFSDDLARRMAGAGLYSLCTPKEYGGCGYTARDYAEVSELVARADASAGWCLFIGISSAIGISTVEDAKNMILAPDNITSGVFAPMGKARPETVDGVDGYRISGKWQWGSGSMNADWISGGFFVVDENGKPQKLADGRPDQNIATFARSEIEHLDTWHVSGLKGTGSTEYQVKDVFIPANRIRSIYDQKTPDYPVYKFPMYGFLGIGIAAVALGIARAAIDELIDLAGGKVPMASRRTLAEKVTTHREVAEAEAILRSARAFFYEAIDAAWQGAEGDQPLTVDHRRDVRHSTSHAVKSAKQVVEKMYLLGGGSSVFLSSPLQRHLRDVNVATQHMMVAPATFDLIGRMLVGLDTDVGQL